MDLMPTGEWIEPSDPDADAARRTAESNARGTGTKYGEPHMLALVIKAWNAYRAGTPVRLLAYRPGGSNQEAFPEPK